jgi:flagellum-specific peptidoglycan hydrolase FlgJ
MADEQYIQSVATRIYNALRKAGVPDVNARIITAQSRVESSNYSSNVFKQNNNAFGMKVPSVRKSPYILGAGTKAPSSEGATPYARYASVEDSARDIVHWLQYNHANYSQLTTADSYATYLKNKGYYGATLASYAAGIGTYLMKMKDWVFSHPKKSLALAAGLVLVGAGIYFMVRKKAA